MPVAKPSILTLCLAALLFVAGAAQANNLSISNVEMTGQDTANHFLLVQFDVTWDNSWRLTSAGPNTPTNWDAVWVFVKYRRSGGEWKHATLNFVDGTATSDGHFEPSGATITTPSDGKGVFIYRDADGTGTVNFASVQLRWNYGDDELADDEPDVEVEVMGIEMVYVPQGEFAAGDGSTSPNNNFTLTTINTADAMVAPSGMGSLGGEAGGYPTGQTMPDNASWPNGFAAFYIQKYEISQEQYAEFLNLLTYDQQATRTEDGVFPNAVAGTRALFGTFRNAIEIQTPGVDNTMPAVYATDFTNDGMYNQNDDGQDIACNHLSWADGTAYADWSGLRPMTELEYEKASRGTVAAVADEYAWGSTSLHAVAYTITNDGQPDATISDPGIGMGNASDDATDGSLDGPLRVGIFAASFTPGGDDDAPSLPTRVEAGATFYGVMEMSGNLWERSVTIGDDINTGSGAGRLFTGTHGDGVLDAGGDADADTWPGTGGVDAVGAGFRGGAWVDVPSDLRVSDRDIAASSVAFRLIGGPFGFRAVRSAP